MNIRQQNSRLNAPTNGTFNIVGIHRIKGNCFKINAANVDKKHDHTTRPRSILQYITITMKVATTAYVRLIVTQLLNTTTTEIYHELFTTKLKHFRQKLNSEFGTQQIQRMNRQSYNQWNGSMIKFIVHLLTHGTRWNSKRSEWPAHIQYNITIRQQCWKSKL